MKKKLTIIGCVIIMSLMSGCGLNKKTEETTEITTVETTTEAISTETDTTEEEKIIASGEGQDTMELTEETASETDPAVNKDVYEPLNNGNAYDPRFTGVSNYQKPFFDNYTLTDPLMSYMDNNNIEYSTLEQVDILSYDPDRFMYIMDLHFKDKSVIKVRYFEYNNDYRVYTYEDDDDVGYHEGQ